MNRKIMQYAPFLSAAFLDYLNIVVSLVVFPVLLADSQYKLLSEQTTHAYGTLFVGFVLTAYYAGQFFMSPLWGQISDSYGRRFTMIITLSGAAVSLFLTALAIHYANVWLLFASRFCAGLFAANVAIAQSFMADVSDDTNADKVSNMSIVEIAVACGFIGGGLLGGQYTNALLGVAHNLAIPFLILGGLTVLNLLFVAYQLFRDRPKKPVKRKKFFITFGHLGQMFHYPKLRSIFAAASLFIFGWTFSTQFFSTYLLKVFNYGADKIGSMFVYAGVMYLLLQLFLVRPLSRVAAPRTIVLSALPLLAFLSLAVFMPPTTIGLYIFIVFYIGCIASILPNMMAIISNSVDDDKQGKGIAMIWAMQALVTVLGTFFGGFLAMLNPALPVGVAGFMIFSSWLLYLAATKRKR
ncbi:MFS transporter [Candidatus Babeliales bacterium]|nr:MFS transporter [Candidatus Babeliales bacterium]